MKAGYFKSLSTIDSQVQTMRLIMLGIIAAVLLFGTWVAYWAFTTVDASRQRVYVMENGKSLMLALSQEHNMNRPAEARDHIKVFMRLLFDLEPDEHQIEKSIELATYLGDRQSVLRLYTDLKEKSYYLKMIQGDVRQKLEIDWRNIQVDMHQSPYPFKAKARELLIRSTSMSVRNLEVQGYLIDVQRTDNNPHGFIIERFKITDNSDIETVDRDPNQAATF